MIPYLVSDLSRTKTAPRETYKNSKKKKHQKPNSNTWLTRGFTKL